MVSATNNDGGVSVNGQRDRNNNFLLDGADNNDTSVPGGLGGISSANPDSAQEFRVITNNFDAEFGRNTGAIVDVVTRGGTNHFHGDAYEFGATTHSAHATSSIPSPTGRRTRTSETTSGLLSAALPGRVTHSSSSTVKLNASAPPARPSRPRRPQHSRLASSHSSILLMAARHR